MTTLAVRFGRGHPLCSLDVEGERLLDEDVLAGGDRGEGDDPG